MAIMSESANLLTIHLEAKPAGKPADSKSLTDSLSLWHKLCNLHIIMYISGALKYSKIIKLVYKYLILFLIIRELII